MERRLRQAIPAWPGQDESILWGKEMAKTMCPGQDTTFWKPGDIFEIPCVKCGFLVEFFKDDARRRCPNCGHTIQNPRLNQGCANWCEHAGECLGFDPKLVKKKH